MSSVVLPWGLLKVLVPLGVREELIPIYLQVADLGQKICEISASAIICTGLNTFIV